MPFTGQLPEQEEAFWNFLDSLRHQGHIAESPQVGSNSWTGRCGQGHFAEESPYGTEMFVTGGDVSFSDDVRCYWGGPGGQPANQPTFFDEAGWIACQECGAYLDDAADPTDTGSEWEDAAES